MAQITINGRKIECNEGEYILQIARKNGIYIPAICYLSGCSPTLACRMCMVESDGKIIYSCNAKAKDGQNIITNSQTIEQNRRAIMMSYCINHPLECGVCDKSGECELQNLVHHTGVKEQECAIADTARIPQIWGRVSYDPSLCIVCERCVTACSDKIGDKALKTIPRGGQAIDKDYKDTMSKDAFAVWSKFQKSLIGREKSFDECGECGECAAVCPVGALTQTHFKYSSNAWELTQIPASNPHSSDCELIYYDVKRTATRDLRPRIYRVSSDFNFGELNGAARFGFDFHNETATRDEEKFNKIIANFKNGTIKTIKFNSFITNEEAKILSLLREKFGLNLINAEAKKYQNFLRNFSAYSGLNLYNATTNDIKNADFSVICGSFLRHDAPNVGYKLNNNLKIKKASAFYFHVMKDAIIEGFSKNLFASYHAPSVDTQILEFILAKFGRDLPEWVKFSADTASLAQIICVDESKFDEVSANKENLVLIIGEDFITSENSEILAKMAGLIARFTPFKVFIIPPRTNSLGVALICDLDDEIRGKTFGYNESGDYTFGVNESELIAPALNQQEGTFVNYDARVVPTNAAIAHGGYELNDFACALGISAKFTIDYTPNLGGEFKSVKFDDLSNFYDNGGENHRGYALDLREISPCGEPFLFENLDENLDTDFIYLANPISQFSKFSNLASLLSTTAKFYANSEFLRKFGLENAKFIQFYKDDSADKITLEICIDENCTNGYIPYFDDKICIEKLFKTRFAKLNFKAINLDVLKGKNFAKDPNFTQANLEQNADEILAKQGAQSE